MIKFIFVLGERSSGLAHDLLHCVPGLTLPLGDATSLFSSMFSACPGFLEKNDIWYNLYGYGKLLCI